MNLPMVFLITSKVHRRIPLDECLVLDYGSSDSFVVSRPSGKSFVVMAVSAEEKQARSSSSGAQNKLVKPPQPSQHSKAQHSSEIYLYLECKVQWFNDRSYY